MLLIGDIHGKWEEYAQKLETYQPERSVQVGDFGWGFPTKFPEFHEQRITALHDAMDNFGGENRYIRGNHDNPTACKEHKYCIDDATFEEDTGIFYLGGAFSIDKDIRTPGVDWWEDEELSYDDLNNAIDVYEKAKPRIVISHELPEDIVGYMFSWYRKDFSSRTREALGNMWAIHKPELWVFGHWHTSHTAFFDGCQFTCLNELETLMVDL